MDLGLVLPIIAAPFVGSFIGVIAVRYPAWWATLWGRSCCVKCRHRLGAADLVPIVSWIVRSGRCRYCGRSVAIFYPAIELAALSVAIWGATLFSGFLLVATCLLGWTLLALSAIDLRRLALPDVLNIPLMLSGLFVGYKLDPERVLDHFSGAVIGFAVFAVVAWIYRWARGREGLGLGDAKLLAAAGAWLSWPALPGVILIAAASALAVSLVRQLIEGRSLSAAERVAFGPYLSFAIWLAWLYGPIEILT